MFRIVHKRDLLERLHPQRAYVVVRLELDVVAGLLGISGKWLTRNVAAADVSQIASFDTVTAAGQFALENGVEFTEESYD